ncbi:hypothetical protein EJ110_NYTH44786 [Nymphaea thermarum]|nr:hypothetical protein EJ110_NYTH44786 [Nymphaea thermarum]
MTLDVIGHLPSFLLPDTTHQVQHKKENQKEEVQKVVSSSRHHPPPVVLLLPLPPFRLTQSSRRSSAGLSGLGYRCSCQRKRSGALDPRGSVSAPKQEEVKRLPGGKIKKKANHLHILRNHPSTSDEQPDG